MAIKHFRSLSLVLATGVLTLAMYVSASAQPHSRATLQTPNLMGDTVASHSFDPSQGPPTKAPLPDSSQNINSAVTKAKEVTSNLVAGTTETIRERYPDGTIHIERQVALDAAGNFVNNGLYTMYDEKGKVMKTGQYRNNELHGTWVQSMTIVAAELLTGKLHHHSREPLISQAEFVDGKLNGMWIIEGPDHRKLIEWTFKNNERHGRSTWWYASGEKRLQADFQNGMASGDYIAWGTDGKVIKKTTFTNGRELVSTIEWYNPGKKQHEGHYLVSQKANFVFDWWNGTVETVPLENATEDQKHGHWASWYPDGQQRLDGTYDMGTPIGVFTWWYPSGQKEAQGHFEKGIRVGTWITWHSNGMRQSQSEFSAGGEPVGESREWDPTGQLIRSETLDGQELSTPEEDFLREASRSLDLPQSIF